MKFNLNVLLSLIMSIMIIGSVSADSNLNPFGDTKTIQKTLPIDASAFIAEGFNEKYGIIELHSNFLWIESGKVAEYSLIKNTEFCITNCEAEGKVSLYSEGTLFDDTKFINLIGYDTTIRSFEYLIFEGYQDNYVNVPDTYKEVCETIEINKTNDLDKNCYEIIDTYKQENQPIEIWNKYDGSILKAGDYRWKIKGIKDSNQNVDFIPIKSGREFSEWATWTSSFYVGLKNVYKFDESSGTKAEDKVSGINITLSNTGIMNSTICLTGAGNCLKNTNTTHNGTSARLNGDSTGQFTISFWIYHDAEDQPYQWIYGNADNGAQPFADGEFYTMIAGNAVSIETRIGNSNGPDTGAGAGNIQANRWNNIIGTYNGTGYSFYVNGTKVFGTGAFTYTTFANLPMQILGTVTGIAGTPTKNTGIDELYIWNRSLSAGEIHDLFNNGTGIFYVPPVTDAEYPVFSSIQTSINNSIFTQTKDNMFNVTITATNGTAGIQFNNVNYSLSNVSTLFTKTISSLSAGNYTYHFWSYGNGTNHNFNKTVVYDYSIAQANGLVYTYLQGSRSNLTIVNGTSVTLNTSLINGTGIINLYVNNAIYNSGTISLTNTTIFPSIGNYTIVGNYSGNTNYTYANENWTLFIVQGNISTITTTTAYPTTPINYPTASNFSCVNNYNLNTTLYINGVNKSSEKGINVTRSVGTYIVSCNSTTDGFYQGNSSMTTYTINQGSPNLSVSLSPASSNSYGTSTTATASSCPSELTCTFSRDGLGISTPDIKTFGVGTYNYSYSATGNTNYTSDITSSILTITKATPAGTISVYPSNIVVLLTESIVAGNESNTGDGDIIYTLKREGVNVSNPDVQTLGVGIYNYTWVSSAGANYTAATMDSEIFEHSNGFNGVQSHNLTLSSSGISNTNSGVVIKTNYQTTLLNITRMSGVTGNQFYILNMSNYTLFSSIFTSDVLTLNYNLTAGQSYILALNNITTWTHMCNMTNSYYNNQYITWSGGFYGNQNYSNQYFCNFLSLGIDIDSILFNTNNVNYNTTAIGSSTQSFVLNITYNTDINTLSSAKLYYDGVPYTASVVTAGSDSIISKSIEVPITAGIKYFYWTLTFYDVTGTTTYNTSEYQQTINPLQLSFCSSGNISATFRFYDENNLTRLFNSSFYSSLNYNLNFDGDTFLNVSKDEDATSEVNICIPDTTYQYYVDGIIEYGIDTYGTRNYYFDRNNFNSSFQNFSLYLLPSDQATSFIINVKDQTLSPVEGALVYIQRYYPADNTYRTIQISKTDANGETIGFYKTETPDYRHIIMKDGVVLLTTIAQKVVGKEAPYTLSFIIGEGLVSPIQSTLNASIDINLSFNKTSNIVSYIWSDITESITNTSLIVINKFQGNISDNIICNQNSTTFAGIMTCNVSAYSGTFIASAYIDGTLYKSIAFRITTARDVFGDEGLFIGMFIIMVAGFAFIWNPSAGIIGINAAIIFTNMIGLISVSPVFIIGGIAVSIIALVLLKT